jgi:hemolysin activation/secretion protein
VPAAPALSPKDQGAASAKGRSRTVFFVRGFQFSGNTAFTAQELANVLSAYKGKGLDAERLPEVAATVAEVYRASGRSATASVAEEEVRGGVLTVRVVEAAAATRTDGEGRAAPTERRGASGRTRDYRLARWGLWSSYGPTGFVQLSLTNADLDFGGGSLDVTALKGALYETGAALPIPAVLYAQAPAASAAPTAVATNQPRGVVRRITFSGNSVVGDEALSKLAGPQQGKTLSLADLQLLASQVTQHYRDLGYSLAQVVVPEQDLQSGEVTLRVLEGRLGELSLSGNQRYREARIRQAFSELRPGEPIRLQALERALLLLNETSGIQATSVLKAGKETGTTDIALNVVENNAPAGSWEVNNFGTRLSSRYRVAPSVVVPNVSGRGDSVGVHVVAGANPSDLLFGDLMYTTPIHADGTKLSAHVGGGRFEVGEEFAVLGIKGSGLSWGLSASRPLQRSRLRSLTLEGGLEVNDSKQSLLGATTSDDRIRKLRVGLSLDEKDSTGRNFVSVSVQQGLGTLLGGMANDDPLSSRSFSFADDQFTKFALDLTRVQRVNPRALVIGRLSGQYSTSSLVVGEQWTIGGADSVRGHPQSSYLGDDGFTLSLEARLSPLPEDHEYHGRFQFALFADHGTVKTKRPGAGQSGSRSISGVGFGVRANLPDDLNLRADLGFALGTEPLSGGTAVPYIQLARPF